MQPHVCKYSIRHSEKKECSNYGQLYPMDTRASGPRTNLSQLRCCVYLFVCSIVSGELRIDHDETLDLQFFSLAEAPVLFNQQSRDAFTDFLQG